MNAKEFFDLVSEMRHAQREFFKTRSKDWLARSKAIERKVDSEIERVNEIINPKKTDL